MAEITNLAQLSQTPATVEELRSLIASLDIQIHNIFVGNGTYGAAEYREEGAVGFTVDPTKMLPHLLATRKYYAELLSTKTDEVVYELSVGDPPACGETLCP